MWNPPKAHHSPDSVARGNVRDRMMPGSTLIRAVTLAAALLLTACGGSDPADKGGRGGRGGPIQVGYVVVQQGSAPLEQELPGRVAAFQVSEVRPQVSGVILRRLFQEGSVVRQGQTLYQIDPSIYQAQAAQASANVQSARATAVAARTRAARDKPLADM
jgi:membrane fusion protein (multidrug efflux system)